MGQPSGHGHNDVQLTDQEHLDFAEFSDQSDLEHLRTLTRFAETARPEESGFGVRDGFLIAGTALVLLLAAVLAAEQASATGVTVSGGLIVAIALAQVSFVLVNRIGISRWRLLVAVVLVFPLLEASLFGLLRLEGKPLPTAGLLVYLVFGFVQFLLARKPWWRGGIDRALAAGGGSDGTR